MNESNEMTAVEAQAQVVTTPPVAVVGKPRISSKQIILAVDDVSMHLIRVREILGEKFDVRIAKSGEAALRILQKTLPDLMLIDIEMPMMDGFQLAEKVRSFDGTKDIKIAFLTSNSQSEFVVKGMELGISDYVLKPFNAEKLRTRVYAMLDLPIPITE
ncbi:MAG: response regulator [Oscillospiraceae bacterium]|jgi:PleD family two-component response regulator|nr:response regulator [Oscillospiraceae bacterium]